MTNETKKLFDAPWEILPCNVGYDVVSAYNSIAEDRIFVAHADSKSTANRLARLPELYDALMEAMQYHCSSCVGFDVSDIPISNILKNCQRVDCCAHRWLKLLQKVRDWNE